MLAIRNAGGLGDRVAVVERRPAVLITVPREQAAVAQGTVTLPRVGWSADRVMPLGRGG